MNVVETHNLGKSYGATKALQDCTTLAIPEGHVVALVAPMVPESPRCWKLGGRAGQTDEP